MDILLQAVAALLDEASASLSDTELNRLAEVIDGRRRGGVPGAPAQRVAPESRRSGVRG